MPSVEHFFVILLPPGTIWKALTDFGLWGRYLIIKDARSKGWGDRWTTLGLPGPGQRLAMYSGQALMQEWEIAAWSPPERLKVASKTTHGQPMTAMESSLEFSITPVSEAETKVDIRFETRFSHPVWSFMLWIIPLRGELKQVLERFEQGLVAVLSGE